jgi:hypothetical protein
MKKLILISLFALNFSGCATGSINSHTGPGFIYTDMTEGDLVTANQAGRKRGKACNTNILGLWTTGDASLSSAMRNAGITVVSSADHYYKSILGVWGTMCLVVTGN